MRAELRRRSTHPEVLRYCTLEILAKNPFHAGLEAVKSVADRLRTLTGQGLDGARLPDARRSGRSSGGFGIRSGPGARNGVGEPGHDLVGQVL
ncbi:TIGR02391 family protein [Streptomyces sp. NPDC094468]|uniref:TIGR02391 family protein n=1 Tax=Streptomyces sp. NPDC094468 TaxID=3366066 RepID=UPI0037F676AC